VPTGKDWLHEIKYDGYRMHARLEGGDIKLLTRTGLDWSHRYRSTIEALRALPVKSAYLDGSCEPFVRMEYPPSAGSRRRWTEAERISSSSSPSISSS
jgi:ATP-dependent DNA ligase